MSTNHEHGKMLIDGLGTDFLLGFASLPQDKSFSCPKLIVLN